MTIQRGRTDHRFIAEAITETGVTLRGEGTFDSEVTLCPAHRATGRKESDA